MLTCADASTTAKDVLACGAVGLEDGLLIEGMAAEPTTADGEAVHNPVPGDADGDDGQDGTNGGDTDIDVEASTTQPLRASLHSSRGSPIRIFTANTSQRLDA